MPKERLYVTRGEHVASGRGFSAEAALAGAPRFKKLPLNCCALSLVPFRSPVMAPADGYVFELTAVVPFIRKYGRHPVTGQPLATKDLVRLNFAKGDDDALVCPVMGKAFNEHTHVVANAATGNVYSYDAVLELVVKAKHYVDLLDETKPFRPKEHLVTLQDPRKVAEVVPVDQFDFMKRQLDVPPPDGSAGAASAVNASALGSDAARVFAAMGDDAERAKALNKVGGGAAAAAERAVAAVGARGGGGGDGVAAPAVPPKAGAVFKAGAKTWDTTTAACNDPVRFDSAAYAASGQPPAAPPPARRTISTFTSTVGIKAKGEDDGALPPVVTPSAKGVVHLHTTHGKLNVVLDADLAPRTCANFIGLAKRGYYDGVKFHRSAKNFCLQGGDPTGTGTGGTSLWGRPFPDECSPSLTHGARGILSMANSGPGTNGSQFFVLYRAARHLDGKHTVFGSARDGASLATLASIEAVATDGEAPRVPVAIERAEVLTDPFEAEEARLAALAATRTEKAAREEAARLADTLVSTDGGATWHRRGVQASGIDPPAGAAAASPADGVAGAGVGRYLKARAGAAGAGPDGGAPSVRPASKKARTAGGFGDFATW